MHPFTRNNDGYIYEALYWTLAIFGGGTAVFCAAMAGLLVATNNQSPVTWIILVTCFAIGSLLLMLLAKPAIAISKELKEFEASQRAPQRAGWTSMQ